MAPPARFHQGMAEIRAVALDIGNVLVDWRPEAMVEPFSAATGLPPHRAIRVVLSLYARTERRLDLGGLAPREFHTELNGVVAAAGGRPVSYGDLLRMWCLMIGPRPGAAALVRRFREDLSFAVWSNTDSIHFGRYAPWLPVLSRARSLYLSFLVGVGKPERAFYEGALAALGLRGEEVFFVDDMAQNVEAARALGIDAVQAATLEQTEAALGARGLIR